MRTVRVVSSRDVIEEYTPVSEPFGVTGRTLDPDNGTVQIYHRAQIEDEIVYLVRRVTPPGTPHEAVYRVLRGQEGTEAVNHPEGADLRLLGGER